jgi:hypothetical protein
MPIIFTGIRLLPWVMTKTFKGFGIAGEMGLALLAGVAECRYVIVSFGFTIQMAHTTPPLDIGTNR